MTATETAITLATITVCRGLEKITDHQPATAAQQFRRQGEYVRQGYVLKAFTEQQQVVLMPAVLKGQGLCLLYTSDAADDAMNV